MLLNQNNTRRRNSYLVCWRRWRPWLLFSAPSSSLFLWFCERLVSVLLVFDRSPVLPRFSVSMCLLRDGRRRWYMKVWWLPLHLCFVRSLPFSLQSPFCDVSVCPPARCLCVCFFIVPCVFLLFQFVLCLPLFSGFFLWVLLQFLLFSVYYCFGFVLCFFSLLCSDFLLWFFVWV